MHELTTSEAATVLSLLSRGATAENADIGPSGIPTSTYYATRRRIYESGWLFDRYVPNPWAIGAVSIDFVLAHPSLAARTRFEREWASSDENVILWSGPNVLLGVFFRRGAHAPGSEIGTTVSVAEHSGSLPVYFDFSLPWSRFIDVERETGYPRSLGDDLAVGERKVSSTLRGLLAYDRPGEVAAPAPHPWHSPAGLSRIQQRLVERGVVKSRTFLNLDALPAYDGRQLGEIVFLTGDLRERVSSADVLGALNNECRVSPVLLADDGAKVLLLALGQVGSEEVRRSKVPRAKQSVAATLDSALENIQMNVERTTSVRRLVDHRYDRLAPTSSRASEDTPRQES